MGLFITGGLIGVGIKFAVNKAAGQHWSYVPFQYIRYFLGTPCSPGFGTTLSYLGWSRRRLMEGQSEAHDLTSKLSEIDYLDRVPDYQIDYHKEEISRAMKKYSI